MRVDKCLSYAILDTEGMCDIGQIEPKPDMQRCREPHVQARPKAVIRQVVLCGDAA